MIQSIGIVTLLVRDQDEALDFYVNVLGFEKRVDLQMGEDYRWLTVAPPGGAGVELTLTLAETPDQDARVGRQVGSYVAFVLFTNDCRGDFERLSARGVKFHGDPKDQAWGLEVVFEDLYGNQIDLVQARPMPN
ncbi:MAG TPA: VOC family protein [Deinococcales bacterium]|nr:VOC family protein [Deinococcales bacterium]